MEKGTICKYCVNIHKILSQNIERQRKVKQKIRIPLSPTTKNKVQSIKKRHNACQKRLHRKEKKYEECVKEINECLIKISNPENNSILENVKKLNIPDNQVFF